MGGPSDIPGDQLRTIVDKDTDPWGVTIEMVEMKDVEIPTSMQRRKCATCKSILAAKI